MTSSRTPSDATRINRIRVEYWYSRLRQTSGLSDKQLNRLLRPDLDPEDAKESKTFERLRKQRTIPSRGKQRKDGLDIVAAMECHYPGSRGWYEAAVWDALASPATSQREASERMAREGERHGLRRVTRGEFLSVAAAWPTLSDEAVYARTLRQALKSAKRIDRLGLLVLLYREAEFASEHIILAELSAQLDEDADLLLSEALGVDRGMEAYDEFMSAVLRAPRAWQQEMLDDMGIANPVCRLPLVRTEFGAR